MHFRIGLPRRCGRAYGSSWSVSMQVTVRALLRVGPIAEAVATDFGLIGRRTVAYGATCSNGDWLDFVARLRSDDHVFGAARPVSEARLGSRLAAGLSCFASGFAFPGTTYGTVRKHVTRSILRRQPLESLDAEPTGRFAWRRWMSDTTPRGIPARPGRDTVRHRRARVSRLHRPARHAG